MSIIVINQKISQAIRGESVIVTLDEMDSPQLANMSLGDICTITGATGAIDFIDTYGISFRVKPDMPINSFNTQGFDGYLSDGEAITIS